MLAIEHKEKAIFLRCEEQEIVATIGSKEYHKDIEGNVDKIKRETNEQKMILIAAHEAGHAVTYAVLFGLSPVQIVANSSSGESDGWVGIHESVKTKEIISNIVCVYLSGVMAEQWVFGDKHRTSGCSHDVSQATALVATSIRQWAMNGRISKTINKHTAQDGSQLNYDIDETNDQIEQILQSEKHRSLKILKNNRSFYLSVVEALMKVKNKEITPEQFKNIAQSHGLDIKIQKPKETIYTNYKKRFANFSTDLKE